MSDKIIQVENLSKWFGNFQALKDVNLEVSLKEKNCSFADLQDQVSLH